MLWQEIASPIYHRREKAAEKFAQSHDYFLLFGHDIG
jgi:hypothetical protein